VRRHQLRQMVPLSDTTIYEMEQRGEFPRRFYLTPRCAAWDFAETESWLEERSRASTHIGKGPETIAYTGACRAITNRITQSRVAILSGLAASGLQRAFDGDAIVSIWTLAPDGKVRVDTATPEPVNRFDAGLLRHMYQLREARVPRYGQNSFRARRLIASDLPSDCFAGGDSPRQIPKGSL
jgi:predicted DNA-binding transcriptional regulator AlpA